MNFKAKKGKRIVINGMVQARSGAKMIFDMATYMRTNGMKFREAKSPVKSI
jgi:hypothetical protein